MKRNFPVAVRYAEEASERMSRGDTETVFEKGTEVALNFDDR